MKDLTSELREERRKLINPRGNPILDYGIRLSQSKFYYYSFDSVSDILDNFPKIEFPGRNKLLNCLSYNIIYGICDFQTKKSKDKKKFFLSDFTGEIRVKAYEDNKKLSRMLEGLSEISRFRFIEFYTNSGLHMSKNRPIIFLEDIVPKSSMNNDLDFPDYPRIYQDLPYNFNDFNSYIENVIRLSC